MPRFLQQALSYPREIKLYLSYTLLVNLGIGVYVLIFNLYLERIGFRPDFIGLFNAVQTVAMGVVALGIGFLINRVGTWRCITYGSLFYLVTSVGVALTGNPAAILVLGALNGAATAFVTVPTMPFIIEWTPAESRSSVAALCFSLTSLSMMLGSLIGGWSPRLFGLLGGVALDSTLAFRGTLILGIALAALGLPPMWLMRAARDRGSRFLGPTAALPPLTRDKRRQVRRDLVVFVAVGLCLSLGAGAVVPFYNVFLSSVGARPGEIGTIFSLASAVAAVVGLAAPLAARKLGTLPAVLLVRISPAPFFFLLALSPTVGMAALAMSVRATSGNMGWPIDSTYIAEILPPEARANAFSFRSGAWNLGYALASFVAGEVIVSVGYVPTFVAFGITIVASTLGFVLYFRGRSPSAAPADDRHELVAA
ncbi:MAG TPA: MFS transporter [Thermomicrobiaceae bacterium]|nr:MFS transporter [Thermomicrobiaceae bacterium]